MSYDFSASSTTLIFCCFFFLWVCVLIMAILMIVKWYLVILVFISLMISNVGHLFLCLLAIYMSLGNDYLILYSFLIRLFLLLKSRSSLYIIDMNPLLDTSVANIFSDSVGCLVTLLIVFFA